MESNFPSPKRFWIGFGMFSLNHHILTADTDLKKIDYFNYFNYFNFHNLKLKFLVLDQYLIFFSELIYMD